MWLLYYYYCWLWVISNINGTYPNTMLSSVIAIGRVPYEWLSIHLSMSTLLHVFTVYTVYNIHTLTPTHTHSHTCRACSTILKTLFWFIHCLRLFIVGCLPNSYTHDSTLFHMHKFTILNCGLWKIHMLEIFVNVCASASLCVCVLLCIYVLPETDFSQWNGANAVVVRKMVENQLKHSNISCFILWHPFRCIQSDAYAHTKHSEQVARKKSEIINTIFM